jgi:hypothetical protein
VLFVVAGYPAAGKSTALGLAASGRATLFPPPFARELAQCLPDEELAESTPTAEKLRRRMWLAYVDSTEFARTEPKPRSAVYHLDLLLHLLNDIRPRAMSDFTDEAIRCSIEAFFTGPFCTPYPERAIITLYPEFLIVRSRWGARMRQLGTTENPMFQMKDQIIMGRHGPDLYRRILGIWLDLAERESVASWLLRGGKNGNGLPYRQVALAG